MKRLLLLVIGSIVILNCALAQTGPKIQWQNAIGGKHTGYVDYMSPTKDSGFIAVGYADSIVGINLPNYHKNPDVWVAKLDAHCNIIWQKCYGGSMSEWGYKAEQTKDGGYIIAANTYSNNGDVSGNHGASDIWLLKLDSLGNLQWQKCYGGTLNDRANAIRQTKDRGFIISGASESRDGDVIGHHNINGLYLDNDIWVVKIDSLGALQWQKCLGGSDDEESFDILQKDNESFILTGSTSSNDGDVNNLNGGVDIWVIELSKLGIIKWQKCYGGTAHDISLTITNITDNEFIIGGSSSSIDGNVTGNHGLEDIWLICIDTLGNIKWQKCYGGSGYDNLYSVKTTIDKGFIFCGVTQSNDGDVYGFHGNSDYWAVKTDSLGNIQWQRCLGGKYSERAINVYQNYDGGYIVAGASGTQIGDGDVTIHYNIDTVHKADEDWWVVKLAPDLLPLKILHFTATPNFDRFSHWNVKVSWKTTVEEDVRYYSIQSSIDGFNFETVGQINANGNGNYHFIAPPPQNSEIGYYRLEIQYKDGSIHFSNVIEVRVKNDAFEIKVWPNPTHDYIIINTSSAKQIDIINTLGQSVITTKINNDTYTKIAIDKLIKGIYIVKLFKLDGTTITQNILVE